MAILLILVTPVISDAAPPVTASEAKTEMRAAIAAELTRHGRVRVIVGLDLPFQPEGKQTRAAAIAQRDSIRTGQDRLLASLQGLGATTNARFKFIPFIALDVNSNALDELYRLPLVTSVELDSPDEASMASSNAVIGSPAVWAKGYDGSGFAVAILDTGVELTHPWFNTGSSKIISQACYSSIYVGQSESFCPGGVTESTADGSGDDCGVTNGCDHGTHVAGTVAGNDGNGPNYGVARGADIIAIQIFSKITDPGVCGSSPTPCSRTFGSDQIKALERVLELSATIDIASANLSIGGTAYTTEAACNAAYTSKKAAIDNLRAAGIASVIASGNDGYINAISQPGCISSAISVGATTDGDSLAWFSNVFAELDLLAPGTSIVSSVPGGGTGSKQGTSMATPHVAGAWAVLKQVWPAASVTELEDLFKSESTATLIDDNRGGGIVTGMKRINLDLTVETRLGQLSGNIVDSADAGLPVYPVKIDLVDATDGTLLGKNIINNPDGSWEISGIVPGDFKVLFDAYGSANGYVDELYDDVACDGGSCDMQNLGAPVAVAMGSNTLDINLTRVFLLSGHITDQNAQPLANVLVEVFDNGGATVGGVSFTDEAGFWSHPVVTAGNYYANTSGGGPRLFVHEIWNDIPCDGCDPETTGTAIVVSDSDIAAIDFQLAAGGGALSGVILDADDGVSAVYPVAIDLIDPATGLVLEGFSGTNNADGSYELSGIPAGDYKVFFNAFAAADAWVDELHDNVPCVSLNCNPTLAGAEFNIANGPNQLDADLSRLTLSGTLYDENTQPIAGVAIDVLDSDGFLVDSAAFTNELGKWTKHLPGPGSYFVRTVGDLTPQHIAEIWDNIPCNGCDPVLTGTPIVVTDSDFAGIDFQLALADGTISGKVVNSEDGITPVYPVAVDLINPITGEDPPGLDATTSSDGRYQITDIPPGEYKIMFNAVNAANHYVDELYDGISCDNGGCDRASLGDVIMIQPGPNSLDVDLLPSSALGTMFGTVVDAADGSTPVHPVAIDLADPVTGDWLGISFTNYPDGSWNINGLTPGDYKVLFNAYDSADHYLDELYDGLFCDNGSCDVQSNGQVFTVYPGSNELNINLSQEPVLSGTVVDAADGITPIHPVAIALFDPVTGNKLSGLETGNNPDGSYAIHDIPPGDYKIVFNAYGPANAYLDELYNGRPCDNVRCDRATQGELITINEGKNWLNVDLVRGYELSGSVTDRDGLPIANYFIQILDENGNRVGFNGTSDETGYWSLAVPEPGSYFAWTPEWNAGGYQSETWDNIACDGCDPVTTGKPIVVTDSDIGNIDFQMELPLGANSCRSGNVISASSFEDIPFRQIVFTSNAGAVFTGPGEQAEFSVEFTDEFGTPLDPSKLTWCLENTDHLDIDANGMDATVSTTGFDISSVELIVRDPETLAEARATLIFADLQSDAFLIGEDIFQRGQTPALGETSIIRLARTPYSEELQVGQVVASGDKLGILGRIISIALFADYIEFTIEPASIPDLFKNLEIDTQSAPHNFVVNGDVGGEAQLFLKNARHETSQAIAQAEIKCEGGIVNLANIPLEFDVTHRLRTIYKLDAVSEDLNHIEITSIGKVEITGGLAQLQIDVTPFVKCAIQFGTIPLPFKIPVGPVLVGLDLAPNVGFEAKASSPGLPKFKIGGPTIVVNAAWTAGFGWNVSEGYFGVGSFGSKYSSKPANAPEPEPDAYAFTITPFGGADIELGLSFAGFLQYGFPMFKFQYGMPFEFKIERPISPPDFGYKGPSWQQTSKTEFKFDPGIADFITNKLDTYFGLSPAIGNWDLSIPLYSDEELLRKSPNPTLKLECHPWPDCFMDPEKAGNADFSVNVTDPYWIDAIGKVDLVGWDDPQDVSLELVSNQAFSLGSATGNWQPGVEHKGNWVLDGLLWDVDLVSSVFPYITQGTTEVDVGSSYTLNLEKIDQRTNLATNQGEVLSAPEGIDCGTDCEWAFAIDSEITLTATDAGQWHFVKWADNSGTCAGSTNRVCIVAMDADKSARVVFEFLPRLTVQKVNNMGVVSTEGSVTTSPAGIDCGTSCEAQFSDGLQVTLTANDTEDWLFVRWAANSESCAGSTNKVCVVTMNDNIAARPVFELDQTTLHVLRLDMTGASTTKGTVTSTPIGIDCGTSCSTNFITDSAVNLAAVAHPGWEFVKWHESGECPGLTYYQCPVTVSVEKTAIAVFQSIPITLTVHKLDGTGIPTTEGSVTSSPSGINCGENCNAQFDYSSNVTLTASDIENWKFIRWASDSDACANSTAKVCAIQLTSDTTVKPVFEPDPHVFTVQKVDTEGAVINQGNVTSQPAGIDCGNDCEGLFEDGISVTLSATSTGVWFFKKWADDSGVCAGSTEPSCLVNMDSNKSAKAVFERLNYELAFMGRTKYSDGSPQETYEHMVVQDGQAISLYPGGSYHFRLKLDGAEVRVNCISSPGFVQIGGCHDLGGPLTCQAEPSTNGYGGRFARNQSGVNLVYGGPNYQVPGLTITMNDVDNDREVTFTLDVTVVTALFQSVNGQDFSIIDSNGAPTGGTFTFHEADRTLGILAGYKGEWSATEPWGRYGVNSGIWYPWFRGGDLTHTTYVCPDDSVKTFEIYGAAQLYDTVDCNNGPDWLVCTSEGCSTNYNLYDEICPSP